MYGQQSGDEFQTHQAEVLTYCFSSNTNATTNKSTKPKKKNQEKLTLNIIQPLKTIRQRSIQSPQGKPNKRSVYTNQGRQIKIGDAIFKSNFQCGSLGQVSQLKGQNTYLIKLDKQPNSNRPTAWFYFRCQGLRGEVNFIISGFTKSTSLYNQGMKICCREIRKDNHYQNNHLITNSKDRIKSEWSRGGSRISYCANLDPENDQTIFELKFTYNFVKLYEEKEFPTVEFAYCFPYEFKRVNILTRNLVKRNCAILQSLGKTYQGRDIPLITIGNPNATNSIVLSARVHPGETVGSFIMQGLLKELTSDSEFSKLLKDKYLFKIVPMINPDGVVKGNYRFSGAGYDLNRRWKHCYESSHPEIYHLKNMIKKLNKDKKVVMYIDIHGHSRKKSAFFYGCCAMNKEFPNIQQQGTEQQIISRPKQFPFLMSKLNHNFKYEYCTFNMSKDKQGTARIQMWKELHIDHVYTLESSFCGNADNGNNYCEEDFLKMGKSLLEGISVYFYEKNAPSARQDTMSGSIQSNSKANSMQLKQKSQKGQNTFDKFINILHKAKQELKNNPLLMNIGMADSDSGSDSEPQAGTIPQDQRYSKSTTLTLDQKIECKTRQKNQDQIGKQRSPTNIKNNKSIKITVRQQNNKKKNRLTPQQLKYFVDQKLQNLKSQQEQKRFLQKQVMTMAINNFYSHNSQQLDSLTSQSLVRKNDRVHSKQGATKNMLQKFKGQRLNSENPIPSDNIEVEKEDQNEQDDKKKLEIMKRNLLKTREGVQYRRVKKLAQQMKKKHSTSMTAPTFQQPPMPMVRGIVTVNNQLNLSKRRMKSIAPSFYPQSQQKNRRFSVQMAYRNNSFRNGKIPLEIANKRFVINGDDINVHCKGTKIYM